MPADKKDEWCADAGHRKYFCEEDPLCRPPRGNTPHERECWAVAQAFGGYERNVREDVDNSCALRYWAAFLDDVGDMNDRAAEKKVLSTAPVESAAREYAAAQHSLARAARAVADALERRDANAYKRARQDLEAEAQRSSAAARAYVIVCEDTR